MWIVNSTYNRDCSIGHVVTVNQKVGFFPPLWKHYFSPLLVYSICYECASSFKHSISINCFYRDMYIFCSLGYWNFAIQFILVSVIGLKFCAQNFCDQCFSNWFFPSVKRCLDFEFLSELIFFFFDFFISSEFGCISYHSTIPFYCLSEL